MNEVGSCSSGIGYSRPTVTQRLKEEKVTLEERLSKINSALEKLEANPEMADLLEAISRVV